MGYSEERRPIGGPDGTPTGRIPPVDMGSRPAIFLAGQAEGAAVRPALLQRRCDEQNLRRRFSAAATRRQLGSPHYPTHRLTYFQIGRLPSALVDSPLHPAHCTDKQKSVRERD